MRDLRADSRFDSIRLRFRSSITDTSRFESSEPGFSSAGVWLGSSEPELEVTGLGLVGLRANKKSGQSHGVKPPSNPAKGFPSKGSEAEIAESMAANISKEW